MAANALQRRVQPGEHVREEHVGVHLARVVDDVGKNRHDLAEGAGFVQESLVQSTHLGPELDARHGKAPLEALLQVSVNAGVLLGAQRKVRRDVDRIRCGVALAEEDGKALVAHLVRHRAHLRLTASPAGGGFGVHQPVENHHRLRLEALQQGGKLAGDVISGEHVSAQQVSAWARRPAGCGGATPSAARAAPCVPAGSTKRYPA